MKAERGNAEYGELVSIHVTMLSLPDLVLVLDLDHSVAVFGFHSIPCLALRSSQGQLDRHLSKVLHKGTLLASRLRQAPVQPGTTATTVVCQAITLGSVLRGSLNQLSMLLALLLGVELLRRLEVASHLLLDVVV